MEEGRELQTWEQTPTTLHLYNTPLVCVATNTTAKQAVIEEEEEEEQQQFVDQQQRPDMMMTTQTVHDATTIDHDQHHYHILNCGHCGSCSNVHDIWIYNETRDTLTSIATECTKQGFYRFKNINYVKQCFQAHSQLSSDCVECWIQNVQCNWNHCFKTCIKHKAPPFKWLPSLYHRKHESPLDQIGRAHV